MTVGELCRRVWYLLNRTRFERQLEEEMASHRAMMRNPRGFGNHLKLRESARDAWGWGWLDRAWQDLHGGVRVLRRAPAFSVTAFLILSAGIGLNLTFFHLLNVTTLQALSVKDPATLVRFHRHGRTFSSSGIPFAATEYIRHHNDVLAAVLPQVSSTIVFEEHETTRIDVALVAAAWFSELGYGASLGRVFSEAIDEQPDAPPVVVVSHQFWRARLGSDPQVVGRQVRLNGHIATIIGVAPATFPDLDLQNPQMWLPIHRIDYFDPGTTFKETWTDNNTAFYARLRPGVSPEAATEGLRATIAALAQERPDAFNADEWLEAATAEGRFLHARDRKKLLPAAGLIGALTLLVLLVACANLGNLVLSNAIGRLREFSVRSALGASRWRILRHLLVECGLLAMLGAVGGMSIGYGSARLFASITELPPYLDFTPDRRLFLAAFGVALIAMLAFGLIPAWMVSRRDLIRAMKDGGHQASAGLSRARFRLALVAMQVAGCCALLVVAGAMGRGLQKLLVANPGFTFDRVAIVDASLGRHGVSGEAARAYWLQVADTMTAHPDVEQVAFSYPAPLGGTVNSSRYGADSGSLVIAKLHVDPAFLSLLEIPLISGRPFEPADDQSVVIISRRVAMTMYGTLDVVGKQYPRSKGTRTIVGVAGDATVLEPRASNTAEEYMPLGRQHYQDAVLLAKSRSNPRGLVAPLRAAAKRADPRVFPDTRLLINEYETKLRGPRLASAIAGGVAGLVLTLACLGIFGVVAYAVKLRTKEIGIRRALGADGTQVVRVLLRQLAWPVGMGMAIGSAAGMAASRLLGGAPFYLALTEARVPAAALSVFIAAGLAAALVPAMRALLADPLAALRHE